MVVPKTRVQNPSRQQGSSSCCCCCLARLLFLWKEFSPTSIFSSDVLQDRKGSGLLLLQRPKTYSFLQLRPVLVREHLLTIHRRSKTANRLPLKANHYSIALAALATPAKPLQISPTQMTLRELFTAFCFGFEFRSDFTSSL